MVLKIDSSKHTNTKNPSTVYVYEDKEGKDEINTHM